MPSPAVQLAPWTIPFLVAWILGIGGWLAVNRRASSPKTSPLARLALIILIVGMLVAYDAAKRWSYIGAALPGEYPGAGERFARVVPRPQQIPAPAKSSLSSYMFKRIGPAYGLVVDSPTRLEWELHESDRAVLFVVGFDPAAYDKNTNGADFILELISRGQTRLFYKLRLDPVTRMSDRGDQYHTVVLPPFEAGSQLVLRTAGGAFDDTGWDWLYLSRLQLLRDDSYQSARFPGFNRYPVRVVGESFLSLDYSPDTAVLVAPAPSTVEFGVKAGDRRLTFQYGFMLSAYSDGGRSDGAIFRVERIRSGAKAEVLFEQCPKPVENPADRGLLKADVSLESCQRGDRLLIEILPGDKNDRSWDHTFIRGVEFK
jgi:hypothetical protein